MLAPSLSLSDSSVFKKESFLSLIQVIGASLFIALCAQISIPLWFTPVHLTGQTFAIMLIGAVLGGRKAFLSVLAYITEGTLGLPVFAHGSVGLAPLLGLNGGYFLGFLCQAYLVGSGFEKIRSHKAAWMMSLLLLSCVVQMGFGVAWMSFFITFKTAFLIGFYPFILGEILKAAAVTFYLKKSGA